MIAVVIPQESMQTIQNAIQRLSMLEAYLSHRAKQYEFNPQEYLVWKRMQEIAADTVTELEKFRNESSANYEITKL